MGDRYLYDGVVLIDKEANFNPMATISNKNFGNLIAKILNEKEQEVRNLKYRNEGRVKDLQNAMEANKVLYEYIHELETKIAKVEVK